MVLASSSTLFTCVESSTDSFASAANAGRRSLAAVAGGHRMAEACPLPLAALSLRIQWYWLMPSGTTSMV